MSLPGLLLALALAALIAVEADEQLASAADASARQIEVGQNHACVLEADGRVTCWGEDAAGQVSDWGKWRYRSQRFSQVSAGSFFTCGILTNGSVMCWGYPEKDNGAHRENDNRDWDVWAANPDASYTGWVNTPPSTVKFKPGSLSVGNYHACAIETNGKLACWGKAGDARLVIPDDSGVAITDWTMVEAGFANACAIREGGSVVCFGRQSHNRSAGPAGAGPFVDVTLALYNGCALAADGSVECWGGHSAYETFVHPQDPDQRAVNTQINTAPAGVKFTAIEMSTTELYGCGLAEDGAVHCWGWKLAYPAQTTAPAGSFASISVGSWASCALDADNYLTCWGIDDGDLFTPPEGTFRQTDGGDGFGCALKSDGAIDCWGGLNGWKQLDAPDTGTFTLVSSGNVHACALKSDGTAACWGGVHPAGTSNAGQTIPAAVAPTSTFTTLDAGPDLTCGVRTDGTLQCWGATTHNRQDVPTAVGGFSRVAVGYSHVCAIRSSDQGVECWGEELFFDREGDRTPDDIGGKGNHTTTIPPAGTHRYTDITAGDSHTCAIRDDKKAVCWGYHADSRYAVPGSDDDPQGFGSINYVDIATGGNPNCAIRESDGSLSCWNHEKSQYLPSREILAMTGFKNLGAGTRHMCGIDSGDGLVCWGAAGVRPFPSQFSRPPPTPTPTAAPTEPAMVTNVRVRSKETLAVVSWEALEGADGYTVQWTRTTRGEINWTRASSQDVSGTSTTVRRLREGTDYAFRVKATNVGTWSATVPATTEGDQDDGVSPFPTPTPTPTMTPTPTPVATPIPPTTMIATSTATTLMSSDGTVTLDLPAGSRSAPYQVNLETETGCAYAGAMTDVTFTCVTVKIFDSEDMLETGVQLDTPATLTFQLSAEQVKALGGEFLLGKLHEMGGLMVLTRASADDPWTAVPATLTVNDDTGGATLSASISSFSSFTTVAVQATYDAVQEMYGHLLPRDTLTPPTGGPSVPGVALLALLLGSVVLLAAGWTLTARRSGA